MPNRTATILITAFVLACIALGYLESFSYHDLIYTSEIGSATSYSAIEMERFTVPKQRESILVLLLIGLLSIYLWAHSAIKTASPKPLRLFLAVLVLTAISVFIAPFDSTDVTAYINQGWLQSHYGVNPYNTTVTEIRSWSSDPFLKQHGVNSPCIYGPLFAMLCAGFTTFGGTKYMLMIFLFKLLNAACHIGITVMVYFGVKQISSSKQHAQQAAYLYGCSPFMLLHHIANAHNDIVLAFFTVLSFFLYLKRKFAFVMLSCIAGIGIKYISLLVFPGIAVLLYRTTSKKVLFVSLLSLLPAIALCWHYFIGIDQKHLGLQIGHLWLQKGSLQTLLAEIPDAVPLFSKLSKIILVAIYVRVMLHWCKTDKSRLFHEVLYYSIFIQCLAMCLFSSRFYPWYIGMVFPLALLLADNSKLRAFCIASSCFLLFSLLWMGFSNPSLNLIYLFAALAVAPLKPFSADTPTLPQFPEPTRATAKV